MEELENYLANIECATKEQALFAKWLVEDRCLHFVYENAGMVRVLFRKLPPNVYTEIAPELYRSQADFLAKDIFLRRIVENPYYNEHDPLRDIEFEKLLVGDIVDRGHRTLHSLAAALQSYYTKQGFAKNLGTLYRVLNEQWNNCNDHLRPDFFRPEAQTLTQKLYLVWEAQERKMDHFSIFGPSNVDRCFRFDHDNNGCHSAELVTPLTYLQWLVIQKAADTVSVWHRALSPRVREMVFADNCGGEDITKMRSKLEAQVAARLAGGFAGVFEDDTRFAEWQRALEAKKAGLDLQESLLQDLFAAGNDRPPAPRNKRWGWLR